MILLRKTIEETTEWKRSQYEFEFFNGKSDDDFLRVNCYQTQLTLSDNDEQLINIGLSKHAKILVTVIFEIDNAPDDGT